MAKVKLIRTCVDFEIPFHDNDMVGIVWHGNYFKYFELARDQLLARLNLSVTSLVKEHGLGLPVIKSYSRYRHPLTFGDQVKIYAAISEYENLLCFDFEVRDAATSKLMTEGYTQHAVYDLTNQELLFMVPEFIQARIKAAAAQDQAAAPVQQPDTAH